MDKIVKLLKDKRGGTYVEAALIILVIMMIIAVLTAFLPVFAQINRIHTYTTNAARIISIEGGVTPDALSKIEEYKTKMGLDHVVLDYSKSEFMNGNKIQLNDAIVVETDTNFDFKVFSIPVNIPIHSKALSRSEVYHK